MELAQKALAMDDLIPGGRGLLCVSMPYKGSTTRRLLRANGPWPLTLVRRVFLANYGWSLRRAGRPEEAIPLIKKAIRLTPFGPSYLYHVFGYALRNAGRYEEAVSAFKKAIQVAPDNIAAHLGLALTYV